MFFKTLFIDGDSDVNQVFKQENLYFHFGKPYLRKITY